MPGEKRRFVTVTALVGAVGIMTCARSQGDLSRPDRDRTSTVGGERLLSTSMKGYELFAWEEPDGLWFTLASGTNRQKTLSEVRVHNQQETRRGDWVLINGHGLDRLRAVVVRVPRDAPIFLTPLEGLPPLSSRLADEVGAVLTARAP